MRHKTITAGLIMVGLWAFGFLIIDALTFALSPADPISGRARGCYAFIENIVGVLEPSDSLRRTQLCVGLLVVLFNCGYVVLAFARRIFGRGNVTHIA